MSRIRIVAAGMGGRGAWAAPELHRSEHFELVALVDPVRERCRLVVEEAGLGDVAVFEELGECLADLEFDALAIFTPDGTHADLAVPALDAGKYVFVEKPLEISAARMDAIIDADRRAGGRTFVGFNLRYAPLYQHVRRLVEAGVVGRVLTIQADEFYDGGRTYFRRWNRLRGRGGGLWITKACHDFDLLYWLAGAAPVRVSADCSLDHYRPREDAALYCRDCTLLAACPDRYPPSADPSLVASPGALGYRLNRAYEAATGQRPDLCLFNSDKDTFDHGIAMVTFANGALGTYTVNVVAGFTDRRIRVSGTAATVEGTLASPTLCIRHRDPSRDETLDLSGGDGGHGGGDRVLFESFAAFVRGQPTRFVGPQEAAVAVRLGLAATAACDQHRVVDL